MSKLAKVTINENSAVIWIMLRIIGRLTYQIFWNQLAPSIAAASCNCSGTDLRAARYMIMKKGEPTQTLTRITPNRAQYGLPSQGMPDRPRWVRIQLNALYEGSNSHSQARVLIAGGITHGISSMPRHLRWPFSGMLWTKWATMKPIRALKMTAVTANMTDCSTTIQKVLRRNRNSKFPKPTNLVIDLFSVARCME